MKSTTSAYADLRHVFSLEHYAECARWGLVEWQRALSYRVSLIQSLTTLLTTPASTASTSELLLLRRDIRMLFRRILPPSLGQEDDDESGTPIREITGRDCMTMYTVMTDKHRDISSPTLQDLAAKQGHNVSAASLRDSMFDVLATDDMPPSAAATSMYAPSWQVHRANEPFHERFWIEVDIDMSDEQLVKGFRSWLRNARQGAGIAKLPATLFEKHFNEWHQKRLLPYIDINLWIKSHFEFPSETFLGELLLPEKASNPLIGTQWIRQTVAPAARALSSPRMLTALRRQLRQIDGIC